MLYGLSRYQIECMNCKNTCFDPDCGYACVLERWDDMRDPENCKAYVLDEEFLREDFEEFIAYVKNRGK